MRISELEGDFICIECGGALYPGDTVRDTPKGVVHADPQRCIDEKRRVIAYEYSLYANEDDEAFWGDGR